MDLSVWIYVFFHWILTGSTLAKGSNFIQGSNFNYKAKRYGSYYSTVYFSYSGGKGYARYSRVYSNTPNKYPALYSYMFDWFKTDQFKVYKNTPSGSISVCKNYEADENGTYLGIFTCPLPFVPEEQAYCCGQTDAQYCCTFWDVPTNFAAACIGMVIALQVFLTIVYIIIQLCIMRKKQNEENGKRKAIHRIGRMRSLGRRITVGSLWADALFEKVHAPSDYRENDITEEDEEEIIQAEVTHEQLKSNYMTDMKNLIDTDFDKNKSDVTGVSVKKETCDEGFTSQSIFGSKSDSENSAKDIQVKDIWRSKNGEKRDTSYINKVFLLSSDGNEDFRDTKQADFPLKPLRNTPRIKFNSNNEEKLVKFK